MRGNTQNDTLELKEAPYNLLKGYFLIKIITTIIMIMSACHDVVFQNDPSK